MTTPYLTRTALLAYVGEEVTIRRRHWCAGGRVDVSVITGRLTWVGEMGDLGIIPGRLVEEHGETAVDLGRVLEITVTPTGATAPGAGV